MQYDELVKENARLQAEVERLKAACSKEFESVEALSHELTKARELNSAAADELHQANVRVILAEEQLAQYQCRHEWIDNGEDLLVCPKCGKEDSGPEPFGWVQTSGPSINRFTQEWDVVEEWSDNGYEWVELFTTEANQSAPADQNSDWEDTFGPDYEVDENDLARGVSETDNLLPVRDGYCQCGRLLHRPQINQSAPADKGHGEPVACSHGIRAPHACDQCEAQNAVPDYWEDPDNGTCIDQWTKIQGLNGTQAYTIPLYRHAEQPAPVAVILPKRIAADDLNEIAQGWNCCLDAVERLNP